jgi:hypothetical protein
MKRTMCLVLASMALVCLLSACAKRDKSPVIVCEMAGKLAPTAFTFDKFKATLEAEHGEVTAVPYVSLKSRSVQVYFKPLDEHRVLAERVFVVASQKEMSAAVLFGLAGATERRDNGPVAP